MTSDDDRVYLDCRSMIAYLDRTVDQRAEDTKHIRWLQRRLASIVRAAQEREQA